MISGDLKTVSGEDPFPRAIRPNLLGIGAAKSGTTWLATVLSRHPEIFVHPQKELIALAYENIDERLEEYAPYFRGKECKAIRCDFSVLYLDHPLAAAAASRITPNAKLLAVLRNPVDQVQSHYWHLRRQNFHQYETVANPPDLFEALERYPVALREPALYGKHLSHWLEYFPRERLLVLDHSDLVTDSAAVLAEICAFLEIGPFDFSKSAAAVTLAEGRGGVQPRSGAIGKLFPPLYASVSRGPFMWLKKAIGVRAADGVKRALRLRQLADQVFFTPGYPKLDSADRQRLFEVFEDDIQLLMTIAPFAVRWTS
jgi:hypothetical protein